MQGGFEEVLNFWFGQPDDPSYGKSRSFWFSPSPAFDRQMRSRFLPTYQQAARGEFDSWQDSALSCLALIILLDQFPRNLFRGQPQAFATDSLALKFAQQAVAQGCDRDLLPVQRWFIYLPFEHSENLEHQQQAVSLFSTLAGDPESTGAIRFAYRHLEIIQRFGRFPHRNAILGRPSSPEELEFLQQPGSGF
jgi:uncharacterized protein (DUF924 family)